MSAIELETISPDQYGDIIAHQNSEPEGAGRAATEANDVQSQDEMRG